MKNLNENAVNVNIAEVYEVYEYKITKELKKQQINNVHSELREKSIIFRRCGIGKHNTTHRDMHNFS